MRVLVIPWNQGMGDLVRCDPLLRGIKQKYPNCHLSVNAIKTEILSTNPYIDSFGCNGEYDLIYNCSEEEKFPEDFKKLNQWELGFNEVYKLRKQNTINISEWLCKKCNIDPDDKKVHFYFKQENEIFAKEYLKNINKPLIVIHTISQGNVMVYGHETNRNWSFKNFIELINSLKKDFHFIVIGAMNEINLKEISEKTNCDISLNSLLNNLALIKYSDYFIGIDSCPSHVAMACDIPSVVVHCDIFSYLCHPTNSRKNYQFVSNDCFTVETITVEMVYNAFLKLQKTSIKS
jgi:ADP-heptose:LPS heptosyltransferase